jgi:hypothetical protein
MVADGSQLLPVTCGFLEFGVRMDSCGCAVLLVDSGA